jgi:hypothetical protein
MFQGRQRFGFRLGSDLGKNAFPHLEPWRQRVMIGVDCVAEQASEGVGFLIGWVGFISGSMGRLTNASELVPLRKLRNEF